MSKQAKQPKMDTTPVHKNAKSVKARKKNVDLARTGALQVLFRFPPSMVKELDAAVRKANFKSRNEFALAVLGAEIERLNGTTTTTGAV